DEHARNPEKALESTLTAGGIAEAFEDHAEHHLGQSAGLGFEQTAAGNENTVTPLRRRVRDTDQLGDSSESRVSKTS
ncbi:MAG: rane protein, partial [Mycobacterium sp.]|nr:rane protein [Mycobacterium sp.]